MLKGKMHHHEGIKSTAHSSEHISKMNMPEHHNHDTMEHDHEDNQHEGHSVKEFKDKFFISLIITLPILLLSPVMQGLLNISFNILGSKIILSILASIVVIYGGMPFFVGAIRELKSKNFGMMTLVAFAVLSGYLYSLAATFLFEAPDFYWEISTLVVFLLFGHWMEMKAVTGATGALGELAKLIPKQANVLRGNEIVQVNTNELKIGDIFLVKPGEKIPIDGIVIEGETNVNESMITGESKPILKIKNDLVVGGSINFDGSIKVKVTKTGKDTILNQIVELVKQAQSSKPKTQRIADKAANYLTISAIAVGIIAFFYWIFIGNQTLVFALTIAITVIVIACPHALGLAIPVVTTISTTIAAKNGMLIKDMSAMEIAEKIDYILFDKTGTLTKGVFEVTDIIGDKKTLEYASSIELHSEHVIAKGIIQKAKEMKIKTPEIKNFKAIPGKGAVGRFINNNLYAGNLELIKQFNLENNFKKEAEELASKGKTVVYVAYKTKVIGIIALSDVIREEAIETIVLLKQMGIKTAMLTGDNNQTAKYVADELGINEYFANVLPEDKVKKVKELQKKGKVAMVGDGINDAPALTQADIGIAIGAGTEVAIQSAEVILVKDNPLEVVKLIRLSKETKNKMRQNLWWAAGYNIFTIPIAAGVLYPIGISLRPEFGALIMAASSMIVVGNSLLLKKFK
ncbi:MAG: heavy metal translocating P-type ATPase [Nanoarchaeota archaeon]